MDKCLSYASLILKNNIKLKKYYIWTEYDNSSWCNLDKPVHPFYLWTHANPSSTITSVNLKT